MKYILQLFLREEGLTMKCRWSISIKKVLLYRKFSDSLEDIILFIKLELRIAFGTLYMCKLQFRGRREI